MTLSGAAWFPPASTPRPPVATPPSVSLAAPPAKGIDVSALVRQLFAERNLPRSEQWRSYLGKELDPNRIESIIRAADYGYLVQLTDMILESLMMDGHASGVALKRCGALPLLPWSVQPSKVIPEEAKFAKELADFVTSQFLALGPALNDMLHRLSWASFHVRGVQEIHWYQQFSTRNPWRIAGFGWIHPRRVSYDMARQMVGIDPWRERPFTNQEGITFNDFPGKFVQHSPSMFSEYPEREGTGIRSCFWTWFKRFAMGKRMALVEVFALPWRILGYDPTAQTHDADALAKAVVEAEKLGQAGVCALPNGIKMDIVGSEGRNSGADFFAMTSDQCDGEQSKLQLGTTGTTDADQGNRASAIIGKGEQSIFLGLDAMGVSGAVTRDVVGPMVSMNYGADAMQLCPRFLLDATTGRDRLLEVQVRKAVLDMGAAIAVSDLRESSAVRAPEVDDAGLPTEEVLSPGVASANFVMPGQPFPKPTIGVPPPTADFGATPGKETPEDRGVSGAEDLAAKGKTNGKAAVDRGASSAPS